MADQEIESESTSPSAEDAVHSVEQAAAAVQDAIGGPESLSLPDLADGAVARNGSADTYGMNLLNDVALRVKIELGRTQMFVEDVLRLNTDSVIELDKAAGDPVDIYVNERLVARGEVLVLNENFCVRISEIIQPSRVEG